MINAGAIVHALETLVYRAVCVEHGDRVALACSRALCDCLCLNFRGRVMYVPTPTGAAVLARHEAVWADFNGRNHVDLAAQYKLSTVQVYNIIRVMRVHYVRQRQNDLFGFAGEDEDKRPLTLIVLQDYLPAELARAGLSGEQAKAMAKSVEDKLCADYPGAFVRGFDDLYRARQNGNNGDFFDEAI